MLGLKFMILVKGSLLEFIFIHTVVKQFLTDINTIPSQIETFGVVCLRNLDAETVPGIFHFSPGSVVVTFELFLDPTGGVTAQNVTTELNTDIAATSNFTVDTSATRITGTH